MAIAYQKQIEEDFGVIMTVLKKFPDGANAEEIITSSGKGMELRTLQRRLEILMEREQVISIGTRRLAKYYLANAGFHLLPFTSPLIGYFAGGIEFDGGSLGIMGKTIDGGNTWNVFNYPFDDIVSASFVNDNIGYVSMLTASGNIAQSYSGSKLIKTTDGGNSWQVILENPIGVSTISYYNLHFITETEGFCTNYGILHSNDGGKNRKKESSVIGSLLCFPDSHTAYVVDTGGIVYKRVF